MLHHPRASLNNFQLLSMVLLYAVATHTAEATLEQLFFGSCAKEDQPQPIWDTIVAAKPQRFALLSDTIFGDTENMDVPRKKYASFEAQPGIQKLRAACPVLATWDDHDYGNKNTAMDYKMGCDSQQMFFGFLGHGRG